MTSAVNFGFYSVFARAPNTSGVGTLAIRCTPGQINYAVALSTGQSRQFFGRVLSAGGDALNYNLYTDATRRIVWGDGTGGSAMLRGSVSGTGVLNIFGSLPAGQDVPAGTYTDQISVTLDF